VDRKQAVASALKIFESYVHNLWWDVAVAPSGTDQSELSESLRAIVIDSWELLNNLFKLKELGIDDILSAEFVSRYFVQISTPYILIIVTG
jgi:hypothetical protein